MNMRKSLEDTWRVLESMGHEMPRMGDGTPHVASRMQNLDDAAPVNIAFFRTMWQQADLSNLTLARMFFGRSGFEGVKFRNTDLSQSRMCWNDFVRCDFTGADMRGCDLRAVNFDGCVFADANLSGADLRRSTFDACIFTGADLTGAIAHKRSAAEDLIPLLTKKQQSAMRWVSEDGPEPPGG